MKKRTDNNQSQSIWKQLFAGILILGILSGITVLLSSADMPLPERKSELIISFKLEGAPIYATEQDEGGRLDHMQRRGEQRVVSRSDVIVRVSIAETVLFEDRYRPSGIFRRGYSNGIINIPLDPGSHTLKVQFGNYIDGEIEWKHSQQRQVEIEKGDRIVLKFNDQRGFRWYGNEE